MGFLTPLFLVAASAVAVPIVLHLLHRHRARRVPFPAIRYLRRTEREHARRIRLRQLLLLLVRCAAILLLVTAGARMVVRGRSDAHEPTALAIILDNSLSSARVVGERRVLDELKDVVNATLDRSSSEDRIWVIRAGEPWDVTLPTGPGGARVRVAETEASDAAADLSESLSRARALVEAADLETSEIHLVSDLQWSGLTGVTNDDVGGVPVVVWYPDEEDAENHFLAEPRVGGGLPPLSGQRTEVAVGLGGGADTALMTVRLVIDGEIRAAASGKRGESVVLPMGPYPPSEIAGWVETDPDALSGDDRRYLVFDVRPPVRIARTGPSSFFLDQGLGVLTEAGRARLTTVDSAEIVVATEGEGANDRPGRVLVVVPPEDPNRLPALNRRLSVAGIPWSYELEGAAGEASIAESRPPLELAGVRVRRHYTLVSEPGTPASAELPGRLSTGEPFLITDEDAQGLYVLLATPLDTAWTNLPVSAGMLPFLQWMAAQSTGTVSAGRSVVAGEPISLGPGVTHVDTPDGTRHPVGAGRSFERTGEAGLYTILRNDTIVERTAVNPPLSESSRQRATERQLEEALGSGAVHVDDIPSWERTIFVERQGPEIWRLLLVAVLLLLLAEGWIAAPIGFRSDHSPVTHPGLESSA